MYIKLFNCVYRYWFPRILFTHHLWNDQQKQEFNKHSHAKRLAHYHTILENLEIQVCRHTEGDVRIVLMQLLTQVSTGYCSRHTVYSNYQNLLGVPRIGYGKNYEKYFTD